MESIPRKSSRPAVSARKNRYLSLDILLMKGSHNIPITTGITPTYVPMTANVAARPHPGSRTGAADWICLSNRVPSSVVIPTV